MLEVVLKGSVSGLLVVLAVLIIGWVWWRRTSPPRFFVIGEEMAQARTAEQARTASSKAGPSPLPADRYDKWSGDLDLSDPATSPLDAQLSTLCRRFAASDSSTRSRVRDAASMDDFYTLLSFSQRSAVFALRDRRKGHIIDGLTAIAIIERSRVDFRDVLMALSLLYYSAQAIGESASDQFQTTASLAEPEISKLILGFLKRSEDERDLRKSWGHTVVGAKSGPGFVGWGFKPYQPSYPMDQTALALAQLVRRDKYGPPSVRLATDLPPVWLSAVDDNALKRLLTAVRGAATINAELRPEQSPDYQNQMLVIFLAELNDETAAASLFRLAQEKQSRPNDFAMAAAKQDLLFCLVVARAFVAGKPSFETQSSLQRFSTGITELLKNQH